MVLDESNEHLFIKQHKPDAMFLKNKVEKNDVVNAKKGEFSTAFKCSKGLVRNKDEPTGWLKVKKNTMNEDWMNFACRKNGLSLNNPM